jgi:hypothetical protein
VSGESGVESQVKVCNRLEAVGAGSLASCEESHRGRGPLGRTTELVRREIAQDQIPAILAILRRSTPSSARGSSCLLVYSVNQFK